MPRLLPHEYFLALGVLLVTGNKADASSCLTGHSLFSGSGGTVLRDRVSAEASVGSNGSLELGANGFISKDAVARQDILIRSQAKVGGAVRAGGTVTLQAGAVVAGHIKQGASISSCPIPEEPSFSSGSQDITVGSGQTVSLTPGSWRNVRVNSSGLLKLRQGTYRLASLQVDPDGRIELDSRVGTIEVLTKTSLSFADRTQFSFTGGLATPERVKWYSQGTSTVYLGTDISFFGTLVAPLAMTKVYSRTILRGAVHSKSIDFEPDVKVFHVQFSPVNIIHAVEEFNGNRAQIRFYWGWKGIQSVVVTYWLNGLYKRIRTMPRPENAWIQILDDGPYLNLVPGNKITFRFTIAFTGGITTTTNTFAYTYVGPHKKLPGTGIDKPIFPYDPSKPISYGPGDSRQYAYAIFSAPLSEAQKQAMENDSVALVQPWSARATELVLIVGYENGRDINDVAGSLIAIAGSSFYNAVPVLRKKAVLPSANPTETLPGLRRMYVECFANVPVAACSTAVFSRSDSVVTGLIGGLLPLAKSEYEILITSANAESLSNEEIIASLFEISQGVPELNSSRAAINVDALQDFPTLPVLGGPNTGERILVGIYDVSIQNDHPALLGRVQGGQAGAGGDEHGTHVAGIVGGDGAGSNNFQFRGIAPRVSLFQETQDGISTRFYGAGEHGNVTNHSHYSEDPISYHPTARNTDGVLYQDYFNDLIKKAIVTSAGNSGNYQHNGSQLGYYSSKVEKNPIVVGATDAIDGRLAHYSSLGPTRDGRIKPDLVAPGGGGCRMDDDNALCEDPGNPVLIHPITSTVPEWRNSSGYGTLFGTSMAAPHVTGVIALMKQRYRFNAFGCPGLSQDCPAFDGKDLLNSSYKAALIHTARDLVLTRAEAMIPLPPQNASQRNPETNERIFYAPGPDFATGWGLIDAQAAANMMSGQSPGIRERRLAEVGMGQGETRLVKIDVADPASLRFTIAWDDPAAGCTALNCATDPKLVNDIELHLRSPSGQFFFPWKLQPLLGRGHTIPGDGEVDQITADMVENNPAYQNCRSATGAVVPHPAPSLPVEFIADGDCYDHLNNVERVDVNNPELGTWTAVIHGRNVPLYQAVSVASDSPLEDGYGFDSFITSLYIAVGNNPGASCAPGHSRVSGDLNRGSGGQFIYLCASSDPAFGDPITNIAASSFTIPNSSIPANLNVTTRIPSTLSPTGTANTDFNRGAGGRYVYAWYSKNPGHGIRIRDVQAISGTNGAISAPPNPFDPGGNFGSPTYTKLNQDLSEGAGGLFHFITFLRHEAP